MASSYVGSRDRVVSAYDRASVAAAVPSLLRRDVLRTVGDELLNPIILLGVLPNGLRRGALELRVLPPAPAPAPSRLLGWRPARRSTCLQSRWIWASRSSYLASALFSLRSLLSGVRCALPPREVLWGCIMMKLSFLRTPEPPCGPRAWSVWGLGPGRFPFANSPAGAVDTARVPRCLAGVVASLLLLPGTRLPDGLRPLGPGFFASPMRSPSCQLWLSTSGCWLSSWDVGGEAWPTSHRSICARTDGLTLYRTCIRSSWGQLLYSSCLRAASFGYMMNSL